jgi:hypothetical protein
MAKIGEKTKNMSETTKTKFASEHQGIKVN